MGLFKRIGDIISANLGEMADQFEDPEVMLKQAVREMEESIREATQETARALANQKKLAKELARNQSEVGQWQSRAEKAVESGDDELARKALSRKREHEKLAVALDDQMTAAKDAAQTLRHQLEAMKAKLTEAKRNLSTLAARNKAAQVRKKVYTQSANAEIRDQASSLTSICLSPTPVTRASETNIRRLAESGFKDTESDAPTTSCREVSTMRTKLFLACVSTFPLLGCCSDNSTLFLFLEGFQFIVDVGFCFRFVQLGWAADVDALQLR